MPDLEDGASIEAKGSGSSVYTIRNVGGLYSCSCPAWRNQSVAIDSGQAWLETIASGARPETRAGLHCGAMLATRRSIVPSPWLAAFFALSLLACAESPQPDSGTSDALAAHDAPDRDSRDAVGAPDVIAPLDATGDLGFDATRDASAIDVPPPDAAPDASIDTGARPDTTDAAMDARIDAPADVATGPMHVHISIDNFCRVSVSPLSVDVPVMTRTMFAFHNHSVDYNADVWMSYGGGFLDLATGATWNDPIGHCSTPSVHDEYADISIAGGPSSGCPGVRFLIHCR